MTRASASRYASCSRPPRVACKPNEEAVAGGEFLNKLSELARGAGGEAPLPERPDTSHLLDLKSLAGNEQLIGILSRRDELLKNIEDWTKAHDLAEKRLPAYKRLQSSGPPRRGAGGGDRSAAADRSDRRQPQLSGRGRSCARSREATGGCAARRTGVGERSTTLKPTTRNWSDWRQSETWQKINQSDRGRILKGLHIAKVTKGATGTEQDVLESIERISLRRLEDPYSGIATAIQRNARMQADKLIEPKTHHVKLGSATLRTPEEVKTWAAKTEQELLEQLKQGPIVVS